MTSFSRSGLWVLLPAIGIVAVSCDALLGIEEYGPEGDAGVDGGIDATQTHDSGPGDATAGSDGDATPGSDGAGDGCAAVLARLMSAPIVPPAHWAGLDLTNGGVSSDVPGTGGLRLPDDLLACASYLEPTLLGTNVAPLLPGYRVAGFGDGGGVDSVTGYVFPLSPPVPLEIVRNLETGAVNLVRVANGYTGVLAFHSRAGGAYGTHSYEISVGAFGTAPADGGSGWVDAGGGSVKRDGVDFPADWSLPTTDTGVQLASPWLNELYDGLLASFDPMEPALTDCLSTLSVVYKPQDGLNTHESTCLVTPNYFGIAIFEVRPLAFDLTFNVGTNQVTSISGRWLGAMANCVTSTANTERMDYTRIDYGWIGGMNSYTWASDPRGLTMSEANTVECNGMSVPAQDTGYGAMTWGSSGEVEMEYNVATGVNYKLSAKAGYKGLFEFTDANGNVYSTGPDVPLTQNGVPVTIAWPGADGGTTTPTALSNAYCGTTDTDCVDAGDCTVTPIDVKNHSVLTFQCGSGVDGIGLVFPRDSGAPVEIFTVNPGGR